MASYSGDYFPVTNFDVISFAVYNYITHKPVPQ